ncbi:Ca-activated chloride channel family protein [Pseudomonas taetrolens]|uniref:Ca-activated chloride channel family protein n=1 Tax=Pseudomonas taetrolens TaxID=47884 RepID=A0A0J6GUW6_PSETA|nr:VWA domain-containing protein [Pseudomonas taetrolens]KMM85475.1 membrane protein [Pseudomonas taetrolens]SEC27165.1 Ca-activated chloride channel family protein [Pseudomonas taetrolens]SQF86258.1 TPR domain protein in aerotolerance operon [Pseudomonas taetrolens]VEH49334.1 TPR domain protein in aerotolerance operon [Pseudomonas taetrolens]
MSALWPHWLRPDWLLIVPLLCWLLWKLWHRQKRVGRWQMILPVAFHRVLLSGGNGRNSKLPWIALGLAWLLALLALLGPGWQRVEHSTQKPADPLVVMLELTPEMLATDKSPNRLEQARRKLYDLLQSRSDAQTAVIVYAGSAHTLVPLSDDLATSHNLLDALKPSLMPQPGHRADLAVVKALKLLDQGALGQGRLLLITSSLSEEERFGIRQALDGHTPQLLMLGVGSREGAPVVDESGQFLKDDQGAILMPRLDSQSLRAFALDVGGRYRQARLDDNDLRGLGLLDGPQHLREDGQTLHLDTWADQGYWLLLPLLLLAACAGRRGWLFCLPLLLMVPQPGYAMSFTDLWLRPDQQGQRLLEKNRPMQAVEHFKDPQWQGLALYQAGDYAGAALRFAELNSASAHYNRGNALAMDGALEAAIDAYEQALELQPDLQAAEHNKAVIERLLEQKNAEPPAPEKPPETAAESPEPETPISSSSPGTSGASATHQENSSTATPSSEANPDESLDAEPDPDTGTDAEAGDEQTTRPPAPASSQLDEEHRQALEQWLKQIPDNPGELLRRKFWYEQQQHQDTPQ